MEKLRSTFPLRLTCICSSSGCLYVLRVHLHPRKEIKQPSMDTVSLTVEEFAKMELPGDIFSSPVMIGGHVYVGCRDDYVHCLKLNFDDKQPVLGGTDVQIDPRKSIQAGAI